MKKQEDIIPPQECRGWPQTNESLQISWQRIQSKYFKEDQQTPGKYRETTYWNQKSDKWFETKNFAVKIIYLNYIIIINNY